MRRPFVISGSRVDSRKIALARRMRREPTASEAVAWMLLRNRRCLGIHFRRQQVIAGFIVDFYSNELRLAIEIDGGVHDDPEIAARDSARDALLGDIGVRVLRIREQEVTPDALRSAIRRIRADPESRGR